jgi:hypothetical protein
MSATPQKRIRPVPSSSRVPTMKDPFAPIFGLYFIFLLVIGILAVF